MKAVSKWMEASKASLEAYIACISTRLFSRKATAVSAHDICSLPYPQTLDLDLSANERILVTDIVQQYRELIRLGEASPAMRRGGHEALGEFSSVFTKQIGAVYKKNALRMAKSWSWPGVICQPFVFGPGKVDWDGADELVNKLDALLTDKKHPSLRVTRICRIHEGRFIFFVKPDRLRYWLPSAALRDADETLADLRSQGF